VTTEFLYEKYPDNTEGDLTSFRAAMVNAITLSKVAGTLGMNDHLLLSRGEAKDLGRARQYILADTFEAVVGAVHLDQGYEAAKKFIADNIFPLIDEIVEKKLWLDPKSYFQELAQDRVGTTPAYNLIRETGPDHDKSFVIGVFLGKEKVAEGEGKSKQEGEQDAAEKALGVKKWR